MTFLTLTRERRKFRRYPFPTLIEYSHLLHGTNDILKAQVLNAGGPGLCIHLNRLVGEGQKIEIKNCIYPSLRGTATVHWLNKIEEDSYIAGLSRDPAW